jgi:hypothetical protein
MAIDVHHCPRCELRFTNVAELRDHFDHDHHADPDTFRRFRYGQRAAPPSDTGRRYLLVANQTLHDDQVQEALRERMGSGAARFVVLVPATHSANLASPPSTAGGSGGDDAASDDVGVATARWRLRTTIDRLRDAGVQAEGHIGHPDPFVAVTRLVADEPFDEIILSTLPPRISRWLQVDLPQRLERRCGIPVTTLTSG